MDGIHTLRQTKELTSDVLSKLLKSKEETEELTMREIRCPFCGFLVEKVFSDISGHKEIFCKKCKMKYVINLGYFRRQNKKHGFKICFPDKGRQIR